MTNKQWWCSKCGEYVDGHNVTYKEQHDERCGGCGGYVLPDKPQSDKTDYVELAELYLKERWGTSMHILDFARWLNGRRDRDT